MRGFIWWAITPIRARNKGDTTWVTDPPTEDSIPRCQGISLPVTLHIWALREGDFWKGRQEMLLCPAWPS